MNATHRVLFAPMIAAVALFALLLGACAREAAIPSTTGTAMSTDGVPIKYEVAGQGEPALMFVHCWSCNRGFWDAQWAHFAPRYRVVRLDLAGHGDSGRERKDYTIEAFGADVAAVVEQLALKRVILIGHSMGGPVAVEAERRLGDRVIGVVGVDTFYTGFKAPEGKEAVAALKPLEDNFPEATDKFLRTMFPPGVDPALVERIIGTMRAADKEVALSALKNTFAWQAHQSETSLWRLGSKLRNINADPKSENKPGLWELPCKRKCSSTLYSMFSIS
jgi:pimeloyl-ACP methyl ester carboxylesterase